MAGTSLHAVKVWPKRSRLHILNPVYGPAEALQLPGQMVVDQTFAHETAAFNIVVLDDPVMITGQEELLGLACAVIQPPDGRAGCDAGPATEGFGNMMFFQGRVGYPQ